MSQYQVGQRWISEMEPELGLGILEEIELRNLIFSFPLKDERRIYRKDNPPMIRYIASPGQSIQTKDGLTSTVQRVQDIGELMVYVDTEGTPIHESELGAAITMPQASLIGQVLNFQHGDIEAFELRQQARTLNIEIGASQARGLSGARMDLIPHQLFIAERACSEPRLPRRLLSDEVGLGKTIEACLIWQKLKAQGRLKRTLILVPESLQHQWMVELYRRFNTTFTILDEEHCEAYEAGNSDGNPFMDRNEILVDIEFLLYNPKRLKQVLTSDWDMVIVDEAHRIDPGEDNDSLDYTFMQKLTRTTPGLLLLTATPVQLQLKAHFARLQLLDPAKFYDFDVWEKQNESYKTLAKHLEKLFKASEEKELTWDDLKKALPKSGEARKLIESLPEGEELSPRDAIYFISDAVGTGRSVVRNTRGAIGGFPMRRLHEARLPMDPEYRAAVEAFGADPEDCDTWNFRNNHSLALDKEWFPEPQIQQLPLLWEQDEKVQWLAEKLRTDLKGEKVLCLCSSRETTLALKEVIYTLTGIDVVVFHEEVPLVARDRAAAYFAEPNGAQMLVASEIGSEGRNFQFAHHLVLFDLPIEPGLVEQRIGRLDRIGQRETIEIHVPWVELTTSEHLFEWYHYGLNAFLEPLMGVEKVHDKHRETLEEHLQNPRQDHDYFLNTFIPEVKESAKVMRKEVEKGRDRLLEFNSNHPAEAAVIVDKIKEQDQEGSAESFAIEALEFIGMDIDNGPVKESWVAIPQDHMKITDFPDIDEDGTSFTASRKVGLDREDIQFFSIDHPVLHTLLDHVLQEEEAQTCLVTCQGDLPRGIYAEFSFVWECVSKPQWNLQNALFPGTIRIVMDRKGRSRPDLKDQIDGTFFNDMSPKGYEDLFDELSKELPKLEIAAQALASDVGEDLAQDRYQRVRTILQPEIRRLNALKASGIPAVAKRAVQLENLSLEVRDLLESPQLRLDAFRLIMAR